MLQGSLTCDCMFSMGLFSDDLDNSSPSINKFGNLPDDRAIFYHHLFKLKNPLEHFIRYLAGHLRRNSLSAIPAAAPASFDIRGSIAGCFAFAFQLESRC